LERFGIGIDFRPSSMLMAKLEVDDMGPQMQMQTIWFQAGIEIEIACWK